MTNKYLQTAIVILFCAINIAFAQNAQNVPFKIAERYFVKNTYKTGDIKGCKILAEKEFSACMGMAAVRGADG